MPTREEVKQFIGATFRSVWALELLCFLRQNRDRFLSHDEMVTELRGSDLVVSQSVESLSSAGLIITDAEGGARYQPANEALDNLVEAAEALYQKSPDAVRRTIVSSSHPGIAAFADAFRLRKD